jgi:hypothetical protein
MPGESLEDLSHDELLARMRAVQPIANLASALMADPQARILLQREVKRLNPKANIPDLELRDAVDSRIDEQRKELEKLQQQMLERDVRDRIERERATIKAKYGFSDADVAAVEALMTDKDEPIPSYGAAAKVHAAAKASHVPTPASYAPPTFEMPETDVWARGIGNKAELNKIAMNEAYKALADVRSGKVAGN